MNINWKLKSFIFLCLDRFKLYHFLYFIQKNITKKSRVAITGINPKWKIHQESLSLLDAPKVIEFGAGKNLAQNIYLSQFVQSQLLVDIRPMIDIDLVNESFREISKICTNLTYYPIKNIGDLQKYLNTVYVAPFNLIDNDLEENFFDACISTDTLEHISIVELKNIFIVLKKIIRSGGFISAIIDYSDHYSHSDTKISPLNFLKFDNSYYSKFNHSINYQNRLRHYDYSKLFLELGFSILENKILDRATIPLSISKEFNCLEPSITATQGYFLLVVIK